MSESILNKEQNLQAPMITQNKKVETGKVGDHH